MEGLEVNRISSAIGIAKAKPTAKPVQPAKRKHKDPEEEVPRRQSARLRNIVIASKETPARREKREVYHLYRLSDF